MTSPPASLPVPGTSRFEPTTPLEAALIDLRAAVAPLQIPLPLPGAAEQRRAVGEITAQLERMDAGKGERGDLDLILARARTVTDGQKCALPTGTSLLAQSFVQVFLNEFQEHAGQACPRPRDLVFPKIADWDEAAERFTYDLHYPKKQPDWT